MGSKLTFKAKDSSKHYNWYLLNWYQKYNWFYSYIPDQHGDTVTIEVTQDMLDSQPERGYVLYMQPITDECHIYWKEYNYTQNANTSLKIVSVDGKPTNVEEGVYKAGTVLEIEVDRPTSEWNRFFPVLYGNIEGMGEITVLSDTKIRYVVPKQKEICIIPGSYMDYLVMEPKNPYDFIRDEEIDNGSIESEVPETTPPETTAPEPEVPETTPPETTAPETTVPDATPERVEQVQNFVQQFYENILQRSADQTGLDQWADVLLSGQESGAKVAQGFVDSDEFKARNLSDEEYIKILYRAFLGREADTAGLSAWLDVLDSGLSRMHVFKGFAESDEFTNICNNYGIIRGNAVLTAPMDQNEGVTKFVARCYELCLGRKADTNGINAWCNQILTGANTAKQAAYGFVFSNEFKAKNLSNEEYVKTLYRVFMDREADPEGLGAWIGVLESGQSREHVFDGFADSPEFREICAGYGL